MKKETAIREIDHLDFYLQNHTDDYGESSHTAMMMAKEALEESKKCEWIPLSYRPMTEDELKDYKGHIYLGEEIMILDCCLPESGAEVLITANGYVGIDTFYNEDGECYFDSANIDEVTAWMPLSEPYEAESEDKENGRYI